VSAVSDQAEPACIKVIGDHADGWQTPEDLDEDLDPCRYCFPDGVIHVAPDDLLVASGGLGTRIHRDKATGDADYSAAIENSDPMDLRNLLLEMDPADLPVQGGDA